MTKLALLNYIVQFFFIRICKHETKVITGFKMTSANFTNKGVSIGGDGYKYRIEYQYSIMYWIMPLTGWWSDYIYVGTKSPRYEYITKPKVKEPKIIGENANSFVTDKPVGPKPRRFGY